MVDVPATTATEPAAPARPGLGAFGLGEWGLLVAIASMWGSSFLFIEAALGSFSPPLISMIRLALGAGTLVWFRKSRTSIERSDMPAVIMLGFFWMAAPFLLFPVAQQWIASSLAGMINGGVPIFAAVVAAIWTRKAPSLRQFVGLIVGFAGVVSVSWPAVQGARSTAIGVGLVLLATASYGVAINIAVPLQHKYGSLPVLLRAQAVALVMTIVPGLMSIQSSTFSWGALAATVPLGCLGTALAFVGMSTLVGRVGAVRGAITIYFVPCVAIALGAIFLNETIAPVSLVGTVMVIAGAVLASRRDND